MRIVLFGLTGIGNAVLRALCETERRPILVVTRQETGGYPYYDEIQIAEEAKDLGIPVLIGEEGEQEAIRLGPDVIFSATYHRLLSREVISAAGDAFNLHPSLLPAYPGKNPFYWTLINGEQTSGISIHRLTELFDAGDIVFQKELRIGQYETQGSLRLALAGLARDATREFFRLLDNHAVATLSHLTKNTHYFGQVGERERVIDLRRTLEAIDRQIRSLTPWPLAVLKEVGGIVLRIDRVEKSPGTSAPVGTVISVKGNLVRARLADAEVTFVLKNENQPGDDVCWL